MSGIEIEPADWIGKGSRPGRFRLLPDGSEEFVLTREAWTWRQIYRRRRWLVGLAASSEIGPTDPSEPGAG